MKDKNTSFPTNDPPGAPQQKGVVGEDGLVDNETVQNNPLSDAQSERPRYQTHEVKEEPSEVRETIKAVNVSADKGNEQSIGANQDQFSEKDAPPPQAADGGGNGGPSQVPPKTPGDESLEEVVMKPPKSGGFPKIVVFVGLAFVAGLIAFIGYQFIKAREGGVSLGKRGEIEWWGFREDEALYEPLIKEYEKKNPNVKVIYRRQSETDYRVRLTNALASEQGPDIFEIHNSWVPMFISELSAMPSGIMSEEEFKNAFYPVIYNSLKTDRGIIAMPLEFDALTMFVNEDIFASSAKTPPQTWDELRSLSITLTQQDESDVIIQSGVALGTTQNVDYWPEILALMMIQNKANLVDLSTERAQSALTFYYEFYDRYNVWNDSLPPSTSAFSLGKLAMFFAPTSSAYEISKENPSVKYKTVPLPQIPKNSPDDPDFSYATFWVQGVWDKSSDKDLAWDFLNFMASPEGLELLGRRFKEIKGVDRLSPRPSMNEGYRDHPILGSVVQLAYDAKTWYLADKTNDGESGINTQLATLYRQALSNFNRVKTLENLSSEIKSVLTKYNIK
jgi:ABC-type glycerol-3-phosphate transport system substrate-binding protein